MSLRFVTAGESHGPGLTALVEGLPAGLELRPEDIDRDLARRQLGHGRGGRMKIEKDRAEVTAGVRHGRTLGSPVALRIENRDYANWEERMNPWPVESQVDEVHLPRPGHADLAGVQKYGHSDVRNVLERAIGARDRGPRRRGRAGEGAPARAGGERSLARHTHRHGDRPRARRPQARATSIRWTSPRCDAWMPRRAGRWWRRSTPRGRPTSPWGACSRCAPSASSPASARTSPGRSGWTVAWPRPSCPFRP